MKSDRAKKWTPYFFTFLSAALLIGICSKSSPLYPINDWVDVHCFMTMGKGLLHEMVPYVDLYEQKGPVLYFLYALINLISDCSFLGVYLLETVTLGLFLLFSAKIIGLYTEESWISWLSIPVLGAVIVTSPAFSHGGSVEEMSLFLFAYGLYTVLKAVKTKQPLSFKEGLVNGVFAGIALWSKFTMLGFYVGLCLFVLIFYFFTLRDLKNLFSLIGQFLLGVLAVSIPVLLYFGIHKALDDLFTVYFYNNIFLYPNESEASKLSQILFCIRWALYYNPGIAFMLMASLCYLIFHKPLELLCAALCFAGLTCLTYWGGKGIMDGYKYYDLVLATFIMFAPILVWKILQLLWRIPKMQSIPVFPQAKRWIAGALVGTLCLSGSMIISGLYGRNLYLMQYEKEELPQYQFAEIINQVDSPTLLNFGFLDGGFYYAADVLPSCKYFCTFNVAAPDMWKTQMQYIKEGMVDFVITRRYQLDEYYVDSSRYELVATAQMMFEGVNFTYYLYRLQ